MGTVGNKNINAKLVLLGDVGAGKSSLVLRFVKGQFVEFQESTIGAAFFSQTLAVNDATVKFEIWDTAGQERYHSLAPMYYRGAAAAVIVYDITNQTSFDRAKKWVQELQAQGNTNMVMALAGNKADLLDARKVAVEVSSFINFAHKIIIIFFNILHAILVQMMSSFRASTSVYNCRISWINISGNIVLYIRRMIKVKFGQVPYHIDNRCPFRT
ncbi:hypothetical protein LguiA_014569 [Lonicera macranthoides]